MAKEPSKNDPIENAKNPQPEVGSSTVSAVGATEPAPAPAAKAKPGKAPVYEVANPQKWTGSWRGQEVRFNPGERISEDSYGDGAIENFKNGGLALKEVSE